MIFFIKNNDGDYLHLRRFPEKIIPLPERLMSLSNYVEGNLCGCLRQAQATIPVFSFLEIA